MTWNSSDHAVLVGVHAHLKLQIKSCIFTEKVENPIIYSKKEQFILSEFERNNVLIFLFGVDYYLIEDLF